MVGRVLPFARPTVPGSAFLALELLPGRVRGALVDPTGAFDARAGASFAPEAPRETILAVLDSVASELADGVRVDGCVLSAGGVLDTAQGRMVQVVDMPTLEGTAIAAHLQDLVGAPTLLEHRARLQVHGDHYFGAGQGEETFASVATGDTLGVGILYQGTILAPDGGRSGAHMTVASGQDLCSCGKRGCWRTIATTAWLRARAEELGRSEQDLAAWEATAPGDLEAEGVIARYAANIAVGLANIQQLCMPGLFVLHGEAARASDSFRSRILATVRELSRTGGESMPRLARSTVEDDDATLLGGVALLLHRGIGVGG